MKDSEEGRALKIAAKIMQAAGLCRYEQASTQCRKIRVDETICRKCIRSWLLAKAREELKREEQQ